MKRTKQTKSIREICLSLDKNKTKEDLLKELKKYGTPNKIL